MNRSEHLLSCLAEECCEVGQRVSKALRFGLSEVQAGQPLSNADRIAEELRDLWSVALILSDEGQLVEGDLWPTAEQARAKRAKIEKFMAISRDQGVLS
jgi:NTP pyrophosphatase (non-canonical NTP hydrolase)